MKAVVYTEYGSADVLRLEDVPTPVPKADDVLIRLRAASVNGADREGLCGRPFYARIAGLRRPRHPILGSDVAGVVEAVGEGVGELRPGDEVFGELPGYRGGFAEYACATERTLARKPAGLSFEEAAALPQGGAIALRAIRGEGRVVRNKRVLVNGAAGSAGTFVVQLARRDGAEVTAVDHGAKGDFLRSLGADHVVDHTREDFTRSGERYDLIVDLIAQRGMRACARALGPGGTYFLVGGTLRAFSSLLLVGPLIRKLSDKRVRLLVVPQNREDAAAMAALCLSGEIRPVIDRRYPLSGVPDALRYVGEGRQKGKVVITMEEP